MRDRPEIKDWQMVALVGLIVFVLPVIVLCLAAKFLVQWAKFRWSERCER